MQMKMHIETQFEVNWEKIVRERERENLSQNHLF